MALTALIETALKEVVATGSLPAELATVTVGLDRPKDPSHGDWSTTVALQGAKLAKCAPRGLAQKIVDSLPKTQSLFSKVEIAGPGFINFTMNPLYWFEETVLRILPRPADYGKIELGKNKRALVEFVSANPTGPLHVGHGRGAVVGDAMASVLAWAGYEVEREYYLNDGGVQMGMLGASIAGRWDQLQGVEGAFPENGYRGDYIRDIARGFMEDPVRGPRYAAMTAEERVTAMGHDGGEKILDEIFDDLRQLGVVFDRVFRESSLYEEKRVDAILALLAEKGLSYEKDGALWLATSRFGDDKDRVLRKSDGTYTYFTPDIAYHYEKLKRGYDLFVNVWGADHGGYVPRMKAALKALGVEESRLQVLLIQMVHLLSGGQKMNMSTRAGEFEELATVREQAGKDATRYFFLMRSYQAQLDFDLDLAQKRTAENPVYYIQYAHARICSIFKKLGYTNPPVSPFAKGGKLSALFGEGKGLDSPFSKGGQGGFDSYEFLPEEIELMKKMAEFPEVIAMAAQKFEPHRPAFYLLELARVFQNYYSRGREDKRYQVLQAQGEEQWVKLALLAAVAQTLKNGLTVIGIEAPEEM